MQNHVKEIILDTETTGLSISEGHKIIEIGAVEMINKIPTGNEFHSYINPERSISTESYNIHGISQEFLSVKPLFKDIVQRFLFFIKDSILVIHNAQFDIKFINYELSLLSLPKLNVKGIIDTLIIAREKFPGSKVNLNALCNRFKIDNSNRELHGALKDAKLLSEVYIELTEGRQMGFNMNSNDYIMNSIHEYSVSSSKKDKVVYPTQDEIKEHQEFIKKNLSE